MTIRKKLFIAMLVLSLVVLILAYSGVRGVFAYRDLAATVSNRAAELPTTARLTQAVDDLRYGFRSLNPSISILETTGLMESRRERASYYFGEKLANVRDILTSYRLQISSAAIDDPFLSDRSEELRTVEKISQLLDKVAERHRSTAMLDARSTLMQRDDLDDLHEMTHQLPTFLQNRMAKFRLEVRARYRTWILLTICSTTFAAGLLIGLLVYARRVVIRPFKELLAGARLVASGEFGHRIQIESQDELSELASAINMATAEFVRVEQDLNNQVRERSREVIRNEQLASVGFLAAGVAHEINNPLASIAWSAEALESRLHKILHPFLESEGGATQIPQNTPDLDVLRTYLRRIQDEAFRCKGITERLLDFSRMGQAERKEFVDLNEIVQDVIALVQHLGQYRNYKIDFDDVEDAIAWASPQEMKQVILNLITNSLDALEPEQVDGRVRIELRADNSWVHITIQDNGCGMTDEVLEHLFEPFFTRRRDGRGTGLGLPITSRIVADHGGRIIPSSQGPGTGSRFDIQIPRQPIQKTHEQNDRYESAAA